MTQVTAHNKILENALVCSMLFREIRGFNYFKTRDLLVF